MYEQSTTEITLPIAFASMTYTALGITSGNTPVWISKDSGAKFNFSKVTKTGEWMYWLAAGR